MNHSAWSDNPKILKSALLVYEIYVYSHLNSDLVAAPTPGLHEICRLFIEAPGFDTDPVSISQWIRQSLVYSADTQCLDVIYRNLDPDVSSTELQTRFDLAIRSVAQMRSILQPCDFLQFLGLRASDARLATLRSTKYNFTILHYVASILEERERNNDLAQDWMNLGIEVLKNAADPWSLLAAGEKRTGNTSLSSGLGYGTSYGLGHCVRHQQLEDVRATLQYMYLWARMVDQSGLDLGRYGAQEAGAWDGRPWRFSEFWDDANCEYKLLYGPTPADWSIEIHKAVDLKMFKLKDPPGSYPRARDERVPTKICWKPSLKEWEEGMWAELEDTRVTSQPRSLEDLISRLEELQEKVFPQFIESFDSLQDDNGAIALLQLRSSQCRWKRSVSRRRSHSQPCPVSRWREGRRYSWNETRLWFPGCHLCYSDYQWKLGESCDDPHCRDLMASSPWTESIKKRQRSFQESLNWYDYSFLASISACQDYDLDLYSRFRPKLGGHTGRTDCPWKCSTVKLDQLHVPAELRPYHPTVAQRQVPRYR